MKINVNEMPPDSIGMCPKCLSYDKTNILNFTLFEYHQSFIDEEGVFHAEYCSECIKCGYSFEYNHVEQLKIE